MNGRVSMIGRPWVWALVTVMAAGCAARPAVLMDANAFRYEVARRGLDSGRVVNPLEFDEDMARSAAGAVGLGSQRERLRALQQALFDPTRFPFTYDASSLTAREAFHQRRGNCISFTNLFVALARSQGISVAAAMVDREGDAERDGDLVVVNKHVVAVHRQGGDLAIFDFARERPRAAEGVTLVDDLWVAALYHNNLGAERLKAVDFRGALEQFETANRLAPDFVGVLGNLGVVRRRMGDVDGAFDAYRRALRAGPSDPAILGNLAALYRSLGREREARAAIAVADMATATPWMLLLRGDIELSDGRSRKALSLYRRARRQMPEEAAPWVAIARAERALGRESAAGRALRKALSLDPVHPEALAMRNEIDGGRGSGDSRR